MNPEPSQNSFTFNEYRRVLEERTPRMKSSAKKRSSFVRRILSRRQRGRFVCPAVNPRIKELIPFGQPKGCERFRVRIISRPGRRRRGRRGGGGGKKGKRA